MAVCSLLRALTNHARVYIEIYPKQFNAIPKNNQRKFIKGLHSQLKKLHKEPTKKSFGVQLKTLVTFPGILFVTNKYIFSGNVAHCLESKQSILRDTTNYLTNCIFKILIKPWIFFRLLLRSLKIALLFQPFIIFFPLTLLSSKLQNVWWRFLLRAIEISGPVSVKLGQWAATRRDLFPLSVCLHLEMLQHERHPHSWRTTKYQLNKYLGKNWESFLEPDFNSKHGVMPVGSGCVAQVYKMWLNVPKSAVNLTGYESERVAVAVKVLHPGIQSAFETDIAIMSAMAKVLEYLFKSTRWLDLSGCVSNFAEFMLTQIDLTHEAKMLNLFIKNFEDNPNIVFPKPVIPYVTEGVLVETWQEGCSISSLVENNSDKHIKSQTAKSLVHMLLKMAFIDNLIHSDLHSGNILLHETKFMPELSKNRMTDLGDVVISITKDIPKPPPHQIIVLDCGLSTKLGHTDYLNFLAVFRGVVLDKGRDVGKVFLEHSKHECTNTEAFLDDMEKLVHLFRKGTLSLKCVNVADLLGKVFSVLITHKVKLESRYSSALLAIMVLEGLGRSLDPDIDLIAEAWPYLVY